MTDRIHPEADPGFMADLRSTLGVLRARPLLPLMSVVVWGLPVFLPSIGFLAPVQAALLIFSVGYPGTERLWVMKGFRGTDFTFEEALSRTGGYIGRFFRLGLLVSPLVVAAVGVGWVAGDLIGVYIGFAVLLLFLDFAFTFVTQALSLSTRRAREAVTTGLRMIRSEWPANALYVVVPPLAIIALAHLVPSLITLRHIEHVGGRYRVRPPSEVLRVVSGAISAGTALVALACKGATVAFYLRRVDVGPSGSA